MRDDTHTPFEQINRGFTATFQNGRLSVGLVVPITQYGQSPVPDIEGHLERVQQAEQLGFKAVWLRDVPFNVPSFGDAGQLFDPFTYLGYLAAKITDIALGVASIVLPLRHPAHVAKAAATADVLSGGATDPWRGIRRPSRRIPSHEPQLRQPWRGISREL